MNNNNTSAVNESTIDVDEAKEMNYISNHYHEIKNKPEYVCNLIRENKLEAAKLLSHMIDDKRINLISGLKSFHDRLNIILSTADNDKVYDIVVRSMNTMVSKLIKEVNENDAELLVKSLGTYYDSKIIGSDDDVKLCINMLGNLLDNFKGTING